MTDLEIPGAERSTASIAGSDEGDIGHLIWPTYRRITAAEGGDVSASFQFSDADAELEMWFYERLAAEFSERYKGVQTFLGRIHTMRLAYNRVVMTVSLDWLFNHVACQYTSILDNSTQMTDFFSDTNSQAAYGLRSTILRPSDSIGLAEAESMAERYLASFSTPRISRSGIEAKTQRGSLQVTVQGYSQTLDAQYYNYETEGEDDANTEVATTLSGAWYLSAGNIQANATQVPIKVDYVRRMARMKAIAARRDALGRPYVYGAFADKKFDYFSVDEPGTEGLTGRFKYDIYLKRQRIEVFNADGHYVPAPLIQPGGWSRIKDMRMPERRIMAASDNPMNQFDASVIYTKDGTALQGSAWDERSRAEAIQMQLMNRRI